jgi:hypothetical protein
MKKHVKSIGNEIQCRFAPDAAITIRIGKVEGPIPLKEGERVLFAGNCTSWAGNLDGKEVRIKAIYKTATEVNEGRTKSKVLDSGRSLSRRRTGPE